MLRRLHPHVPALLVVVAGTAPLLVAYLDGPSAYRLLDLTVYVDAGTSLLRDRPVYEHRSERTDLPFTYPPVAALLAVPLALVPRAVLDPLWTLTGLALLAVLVVRLLPGRRPLLLAALVVALAWTLPVRDTLRFGQVNLLLLALVLTDLLAARPRWPRGALVGLAAAIKLTPLVLVPWLWMSGRRREAGVAAGVAAGLTALAWLVVPGTSRAFWTDALLRPDRLGSNEGVSNQSLRGVLLRTPLPEELQTVLWLALALVVGVVGLRRAARAELLPGLVLAGLLAVLLSPVAWMHHLVWVVPAAAVLLQAGRTRWAVALLLVLTPNVPGFGHVQGEEGWPGQPVWWLLEQGFTWVALALLLLLPLQVAPRPVATSGRPPAVHQGTPGSRRTQAA